MCNIRRTGSKCPKCGREFGITCDPPVECKEAREGKQCRVKVFSMIGFQAKYCHVCRQDLREIVLRGIVEDTGY
jgi:hypothetical protein